MKVSIRKKNIELTHPFEYFLDKLTFLPYAEISIQTDDGVRGNGEIACALDVNGESNESAVNLAPYLERFFTHINIQSELDIESTMRRCELQLSFNKATKCGLEQALYHILAQRGGKSVAQLLGARKRNAKIQCTIPFLADQSEYLRILEALLQKGPDYIKFKVGRNTQLESWAINKLRSMNPKVEISVDANQAFESSVAAGQFLARTEESHLCWAEQLLAKNDFDGWVELKQNTAVPLMADESIHTAQDALPYLQNSLVDVINIKLAKCGGVLEARKIIGLAEKFNVAVMLGSMIHGELGLKYNLAFGLSENFITYDFFSYFSLKRQSEPLLINPNTLEITKAALL